MTYLPDKRADVVGLHDFIPDDDHAVLVAYLLSAVKRADWHAVSDAANDLRVLEAQRGKR